MEKIKRELVELGMRFSAPVFFDDGKNMFLPEKKPVKKSHLEILEKWNIPFVITYGHLLSNTAADLDELLAVDSPVLESAATVDDEFELLEEAEDLEEENDITVGPLEENPLYIKYIDLYKNMAAVFDNLKKDRTDNIEENIQLVTENLFELLEKNATFVSSFLLAGEALKNDYAKSAINVAIVTYVVAKNMNVPVSRLHLYITGALLHDIGMLYLPDAIINKKEPLTADEISALKKHTTDGAHIVGDMLHYPDAVTNIVLQHHEHWDGNGYPNGRSGTQISTGARIVAVADAFEAMITEKAYRTSMLGYEAMKTILSDNGRHFSPDVIRVFIQSMGVYPIGSLVLLNDGSIGRIIKVNQNAPLRPSVRLWVTAGGVCYPDNVGPIIKLESINKLFILRALNTKDLHGKIN